ncbi:MAG: Tad domain-containing protein [Acetatifactor sp.]|nr:Tad domain-containing protein [Acetatifactor sp.]
MFCFRKNHGAISVFLVIILVPCMLIASIFVDISRVQLARAVAESSADLALSTLMTNYDYDLSEYYGLMGSCQNISEYYSLVTEYYDTALHSQDVPDEEIQLLYQRVMNDIGGRFSDETISDILRVQNLTDGAVISPLEGANMYNATILQEQIVEFMKYRGPIVIAQEIIEKIKSDESSVAAVLQSDENKTIVDDKTDFYEAEGELLKTAFDVYWLTRDYTDKVGNNGENMSAGKLQEYAQNLEGYRTAYEEIHQYLVSNLINTGNLTGTYSRVTIDLNAYLDNYDETNPAIYSRKETPTEPAPAPEAAADPLSTPAPSPEPVYYIDGDRVTVLREELETARDEFVTAKNNYENAGRDLMNTLPGPGDNDAHVIQWWVQMDAAVNSHTGTNYTN